MDRLDIELYAERLARQREAWWELESAARPSLSARDVERLETLGLLLTPPVASTITRSVGERVADLAAIHRLQAIVEQQRAEARQVQTGVTTTSSPPSSS